MVESRGERAKQTAFTLYEGKAVPHHSCGICMATTFGCGAKAYQSLRKGGITGEGECGAVKGGEMVLGEYLGDPNPTGPMTDNLKAAVAAYRQLLAERLGYAGNAYPTCNALVSAYPDFMGDDRKLFCTEMVTVVAGTVAEILEGYGVEYKLPE